MFQLWTSIGRCQHLATGRYAEHLQGSRARSRIFGTTIVLYVSWWFVGQACR